MLECTHIPRRPCLSNGNPSQGWGHPDAWRETPSKVGLCLNDKLYNMSLESVVGLDEGKGPKTGKFWTRSQKSVTNLSFFITMCSDWLEPAGDLSLALLTTVSHCAVSTESSRWLVAIFTICPSTGKFLGFMRGKNIDKHIITSKSYLFLRVNVHLPFWWSRTQTEQFLEHFSQAPSGGHSSLYSICISWYCSHLKCHSLQRERTLLWDGGEFSVHLPTSMELLLMGRRQPGACYIAWVQIYPRETC